MHAGALPFEVRGPIGAGARYGLIALRSDETIEAELSALLRGADTALLTSRIPSEQDVTPETLAAMAAALPQAAGLLPPSLDYDVVGYGCTSGATTIGATRVAELVREGARTAAVTDPLTATIAALTALAVRRVALVTPYVPEVSAAVENALGLAGFEVSGFGSFGVKEEAVVARMDPGSLLDAVCGVGAGDSEAVFLSCTNLRAIEIVGQAEAALGKPVITSNLALAWHMAELAGAQPLKGPGRLLAMV